MGQTVVEKIAGAHRAEGGSSRLLKSGDFLSIRPRHVMTHDNTAPVMSKFRGLSAARIQDASQPVFALDHDIQNRSEENRRKYLEIEAFAKEHGLQFYSAGQGIGHQLMVERCHVLPGWFVVASDSHANTYGALGAVGTPVVRTDAAAIWATGEFWWQIPRTVRVELTGELQEGVTGKDLIITLCGLYNQGEVLNAAVEFCGPGVAHLSMEARLTVANMTTEWGALVGHFPADEITRAYLEQRLDTLRKTGSEERLAQANVDDWMKGAVTADPDAAYAARIRLDLSGLTPHVSGPDSVQVMTSLAELAARKVAVQKAYLVSCTTSRSEDLAAAARVVRGRMIAEGVEFYVAAASREIQQQAEADGVWDTLLQAGAEPLPAGCGPCIGLGTGLLEAGEVGISATNRNFKGRMGSRDAKCYLASPEVVAASALAGYIRGPAETSGETPERDFQSFAEESDGEVEVEIQEGFPARLSGRLVFVAADNLNTDGIYGKDYTYRDDMTREEMARVVMENYDPEFAGRTQAGDILVGGLNFGTGSSREQAVTCLQAKGLPMVIAETYSQTYLRNAFNNGFLCLESPGLVAHLKQTLAERIASGEKTIIPGESIEIDFASGKIAWDGRSFRFPAMSEVPQQLVIAGGVENQVRRRLEATKGS